MFETSPLPRLGMSDGLTSPVAAFWVKACATFSLLKTISLLAHFLGPGPWDAPVVLAPWRLLPSAIGFEIGLICSLAIPFVAFEWIRRRVTNVGRILYVASCCAYSIFAQLDQEVVRWMGQHVNASYIGNFAGARDPHLVNRIVASDLPMTTIAVAQMFIAIGVSLYFLRPSELGRFTNSRVQRWLFVVASIALVLSPAWYRPSEKRWRRIRPAAVSIVVDGFREWSGSERPRKPEQALSDLKEFVSTGSISGTATASAQMAEFPFWTDTNSGAIPIAEWQALPIEARPNIVMIVFETMRAWNTGIPPGTDRPSGTPEMDRILAESATVFPYVHSNGYPSVEGCMGMHLGIYPHFRKIIFSDYLHIRSLALPEILRNAGYSTSILLGADPSFSNFTPWLTRWYDEFEYTPENRHDGPLVDRFIERYESRSSEPSFTALWTATTHPPYDIPASEGLEIAATDEERFDQAILYADKHVARLIRYLQSRPDWNRTVVLVFGDHAQPTPFQRTKEDVVGRLNPGHTWTSLAIFGGWPGLPQGSTRKETASHIDIPVTILNLLNLRASNHFLGRDLLGEAVLEDRQVASFRYSDFALQSENSRHFLRIDSAEQLSFVVDARNPLSYGLLDESLIRSGDSLSEPLAERYRDAFRAWGKILDQNRLVPP